MYNLPLLPGYGASTKIRSSPVVKSPGGVSLLERMTLAEEFGYDDSYFPAAQEEVQHNPSEYILSHSPPSPMGDLNIISSLDVPAGHEREREEAIESQRERLDDQDGVPRDDEDVTLKSALENTVGTHVENGHLVHVPSEAEVPADLSEAESPVPRAHRPVRPKPISHSYTPSHVAEAVFFSYGVSVFFGFQEGEEKEIMEDCETAGCWFRTQAEDDWDVEEFHYVVSVQRRRD